MNMFILYKIYKVPHIVECLISVVKAVGQFLAQNVVNIFVLLRVMHKVYPIRVNGGVIHVQTWMICEVHPLIYLEPSNRTVANLHLMKCCQFSSLLDTAIYNYSF